MDDLPDAALALRGGLHSPAQALEFVRWLAAAWTDRPPAPEDGFPEAELALAEARLGFPMPAALRSGYALFGRRDDLTRNQDPLLPPSGLYVDEESDGVLVFREENQSCAFWGIPLAELDQEDPPVVLSTGRDWVPFLTRMSLAWVELALTEFLLGSPHYDACELPAARLPALHALHTRLPLPDHPMWASRDDSPIRWYAAPGRLLRHDGLGDLSWLHAATRTRVGLDALHADLPARWVG
ncbi:SMI1/KNR4 family protein [Kitasatospora sp. NPDC057198]|uniref:SMI1/KNR4 family protein n=1 Tax=Kitasatospora sp. NPDC057198 TaxID=3346046 RepID=UPI00363D0943